MLKNLTLPRVITSKNGCYAKITCTSFRIWATIQNNLQSQQSNGIFSQTENKQSCNLEGAIKDPKEPKQLLETKTKREYEIRVHCKAIVIETVWYWHKNTQIYLWNRIGLPNKPTHAWPNDFWFLTKEPKIWGKGKVGKGQFLQQMMLGKASTTCKRMKLDDHLIPHTKTNSKWIKDLHKRNETHKTREKKVVSSLTSILAMIF